MTNRYGYDTIIGKEERRGEDQKQRVNRELIELLNELRVALPGVQVLFAFLLTIPFSQGYAKLTGPERNVYAISLLLAAGATALLIAPTAYHRLHFRMGNKERILMTSNRLAISGLLLLGGAIACAVFVVMAVVFGAGWGSALAAGTAVWVGWFWFGLPLVRRISDG